MAAWKSSDGGSVQVLGLSAADTTPGVGTSVIVSAAANTIGVTISYALLKAAASGDNAVLQVGGVPILAVHFNGAGSPIIEHMHKEYFAPPGQAIELVTGAGAVRLAMRYHFH